MAKSKFPPRGWRNNNPLNIRRGKTKWVGEVDHLTLVLTDKMGNKTTTKEYDRSFCQFSEMAYGWRATFKILKKYITEYKLNTISKIIGRWAPPNENNTNTYIHHVSMCAGIDENEVVHITDEDAMLGIVQGMCTMENGMDYDPFLHKNTRQALYEGYRMAID